MYYSNSILTKKIRYREEEKYSITLNVTITQDLIDPRKDQLSRKISFPSHCLSRRFYNSFDDDEFQEVTICEKWKSMRNHSRYRG